MHEQFDTEVYLSEVKWSESRSVVSDSVIPRTIESMEFSRPEYWSGLLFPPPGKYI